MSPIEVAAKAYVAARHAADDAAGGPGWHEAGVAVDQAWHELEVAVTGECRQCEPGTCPLARVEVIRQDHPDYDEVLSKWAQGMTS